MVATPPTCSLVKQQNNYSFSCKRAWEVKQQPGVSHQMNLINWSSACCHVYSSRGLGKLNIQVSVNALQQFYQEWVVHWNILQSNLGPSVRLLKRSQNRISFNSIFTVIVIITVATKNCWSHPSIETVKLPLETFTNLEYLSCTTLSVTLTLTTVRP